MSKHKSKCETCIFEKLCKEADTEVFECDFYKKSGGK
jgi:hypothetical protein